MPESRQQIRFCKSRDGARIAYASSGNGPPLLRSAPWLSHLEFDWQNSLWQPWLAELSRDHVLVRYDSRGCGLSDRDVRDYSLDASLADFEAVVDAAGYQRFPIVGICQGAVVAAAYAARHPARVTRLVLCGGWARGVPKRGLSAMQIEEARTLVKLIGLGWGREHAAYRQLFVSLLFPDATPEQVRSFNELHRVSTSAAAAARLISAIGQFDVSGLAPDVRCPTLVMHARDEALVPFEEGRLLASLIPGARFVPLASRNHFPLPGEPAWDRFHAELRDFLDVDDAAGRREAAFPDLTRREREVLELLAHGCDNAEIATRLCLSEKTVRNRVTLVFDKLGVRTRAQAIVRARDAGFAAERLVSH